MAQGKRAIVRLTDSLALVGSGWSMTMGSRKVSGTSGLVLVRKGGEWKAKAMVDGGWGDLPMATAAPVGHPTTRGPPAPPWNRSSWAPRPGRRNVDGSCPTSSNRDSA